MRAFIRTRCWRATLGLLCAMLLIASSRVAKPQAPAPAPAPAVRFRAVEVFVDSGDRSLAAYQFEVKAKSGHVLLVGLEGGEHAAFRAEPYYDKTALQGGDAAGDRIVVAAFNTGDDLPHGKTRVARLHVQITGDIDPTFETQLQAAADGEGATIPATVTLSAAIPPPTPPTSSNSQGATR